MVPDNVVPEPRSCSHACQLCTGEGVRASAAVAAFAPAACSWASRARIAVPRVAITRLPSAGDDGGALRRGEDFLPEAERDDCSWDAQLSRRDQGGRRALATQLGGGQVSSRSPA